MITVSNRYKEAMDKHIRNRSFVTVGVGVINQEAQASARLDESSESLYFSNSRLLFGNKAVNTYITLDENFIKADGSQLFPPRDTDEAQFLDSGFVCANVGQSVRIDFNYTYSIKGLTIDFSSGYPTKFRIRTATKTIEFDNDVAKFTTTTVLGDTNYIIIEPITMVGGQQRMRLNEILMGIGLVYTNEDVTDSSYSASVSPISEELNKIDFSVTILDPQNRYDIDDDNSFINFLETKQRVSVSYGIEMDDGSIEYVNKANLFLDSWESKKGQMTFNAVDAFAFMDDDYELGYKIYNRTAWQEAIQILDDLGLEPDEYELDECLKDVQLVNPMPKCTHKEALQLIANACRCIMFQNSDGKLVIRANFANVLTTDDLVVEANQEALWSKLNTVLTGGYAEYIEFTRNFIRADGSQLFKPTNRSYADAGFVSGSVSNYRGLFTENPIISLRLPTAYQYFGIEVDFGGNPPLEIMIRTYYHGEVSKIVTFNNIKEKNYFMEDFGMFEKIEIEVTKTHPLNRVIIHHIALGDLTDFTVKRDAMFENPIGYADRKTKDVYVKIFSYENVTKKIKDENGNQVETIVPDEVDDEVYFMKSINLVGENQYVENPLISNEQQASLVAEWLGNYFYNNTEYDVSYRGEPRVGAGDIVYYESEVAGILQTTILTESLTFNGSLKGTFTLKKALKKEE